MSLPKPERVEIGQWWVFDDEEPLRLTSEQDADTFWYTTSHSCGLIASTGLWSEERYTYLGSGENPDPSEKMIDMLIDVISEVETGGSSRDEPSIGRYDRTNYRRVVFSVLANQCADLAHSRVIGVTYRLLRSLGKW